MARTVVHKLGTDWKFQVAFALLGIGIAVIVGLITERVGAAGFVLSTIGIVIGGAKYRHERSASR